jgi:hypothetical protein
MAAAAILVFGLFQFFFRRLVEFSFLYTPCRFGRVWPISSKVMALDRFFVEAGKCLFSGKLPHFWGIVPPRRNFFLHFCTKGTSFHQTGLFEA